MKPSHNCGELGLAQVGQKVCLMGWLHSLRDHGGILFGDLRDREGLTQIVFNPEASEVFGRAATLKEESVIEVQGVVVERSKDTLNPSIPTGVVELSAQSFTVHGAAAALPFPLHSFKEDAVSEETRLRFRYLDLRRSPMQSRLRMRAKAAKCVRGYLDAEAFTEVDLPILVASSPEGAREFLVPSRRKAGNFYALCQSPQQYKQMLMLGGVERYYSLARCFRDEDLRAERQPEFTQIDLELSFVDAEGIRTLTEGLMAQLWKELLDVELPRPFARLTYAEAMNRFGSDKPDTRLGMELMDFSEDFSKSDFKIFKAAVDAGGCVKAFNAKGLADISQGQLQNLEAAAKEFGAKGLAYILVRAADVKSWRSPILKFFSEQQLQNLRERLQLEAGDLVLFAANDWQRACEILGRVRQLCAELLIQRGTLKLAPAPAFVWVVDFPLLQKDPSGRLNATHHPFTAPLAEDLPLLDTKPEKARAEAYDLVLNGVELGGGSMRVHCPKLQAKIFALLQLPKPAIQKHFAYLLKALEFGAPPHGGIALGFDRLCALLAGVSNIREVIAFPKTQSGQDLLNGAPASVQPAQIEELHLNVLSPPEEEKNG